MQVEPEITFRNFAPSARISERVSKELARLESHYPRITACKIVVEGGQRRRHTGDLAHVRLHLVLPGGREVAVSSMQDDKGAHADVMVAIRDAFAAAASQLKTIKPDPRHDATFETRQAGQVARFLAGERAGFIRGADGVDHYFHENEATNARFDSFRVGDDVTFIPDEGEKGPLARAVHKR